MLSLTAKKHVPCGGSSTTTISATGASEVTQTSDEKSPQRNEAQMGTTSDGDFMQEREVRDELFCNAVLMLSLSHDT